MSEIWVRFPVGPLTFWGCRLTGGQRAGSAPIGVRSPSTPLRVLMYLCKWGCSSVGRALALQARCRRFDPGQLHRVVVTRETHTRKGCSRVSHIWFDSKFPPPYGENANGWQSVHETDLSGSKEPCTSHSTAIRFADSAPRRSTSLVLRRDGFDFRSQL